MEAYPSISNSRLIFLLALVLIFGCTKEGGTFKDGMIFDFEADSELDRIAWKCRSRFELSSDYKNTGNRSLKFEFHPGNKVGFSTGDVPHDWSIYKSFDFWIYNPSPDPVTIYFQVNQRSSSRGLSPLLPRHFKINPGGNHISIPLDPRMTAANRIDPLQKVDGFFFYMQDILKPTVLYFDDFKLIKGVVS